jgi:hypothetical protein
MDTSGRAAALSATPSFMKVDGEAAPDVSLKIVSHSSIFQGMRLVERSEYVAAIRAGLRQSPIVSVVGPRQAGKTTLARIIASGGDGNFLDLEDPRAFRRLENPLTTLETLKGLVVIDEVQRKPELFPILRVLADRRPLPARFLILGSASPSLVRGVSESLAGRVSFVDVSGFHLGEAGIPSWRKLWLRGGFPRSFLAGSEALSLKWRDGFIRTFLERDVPQFGLTIPADTLRRFWTMLAHFHGQTWNAAEIARSLGSSEATARRYLDILSSSYMVRQLAPWFENIGKRQVKAPKVYLRDSGLLHCFFGIDSMAALESHPRLGASWEGFVLEQALQVIGERNAYFWASHGGAELDLMVFARGKRCGVEIKYADAPKLTKSTRVAFQDLNLERVLVVYPGKDSYPLEKRVEAVSILEARAKLAAIARG